MKSFAKAIKPFIVIGAILPIASVFGWGEAYKRITLDQYKEALLVLENRGGRLYCPDGEEKSFENCTTFTALREQGCYGYSTAERRMEANYSDNCLELESLSSAQSFKENFFDLETKDWWKWMPAEIIPVSGGIYSDESWRAAQKRRDTLVKGKRLDQINLQQVSTYLDRIEIIIGTKKESCGDIEDYLEIDTMLLADFNNDGVAELLLKGFRLDRSETCPLASANSLARAFNVVVTKQGPHHLPKILKH